MLDNASLKVAHVRRLKDAASKLETGNFRGVVTQANLEDGSGLDLLQRTSSLGTELVVTDPWADGRRWAEAINLGPTTCSRSHPLETEVRRRIANASATAAAEADTDLQGPGRSYGYFFRWRFKKCEG
jgi:DNA-binding NtrC family response regulator